MLTNIVIFFRNSKGYTLQYQKKGTKHTETSLDTGTFEGIKQQCVTNKKNTCKGEKYRYHLLKERLIINKFSFPLRIYQMISIFANT